MSLGWIQATDRVVGKAGAFTDTLNRAFREALTASGIDPDIATFPGFGYPPRAGEAGVVNPAYPVGDVRRYGAKGDGATNDTAAFTAAITAATALNTRCVIVPSGTYVITSTLTLPTGTAMVGDAVGRSVLLYRPIANGTCLLVSAGAAICYNNVVRDLTFYSDDLTYTKVALDLADVSSCAVDNINIYGTGTGTPTANYWSGGTGSIGIRTRGREATKLNNIKSVADYPIYVGPNPNTLPTDGEDMDHFQFSNMYLVAKGHYCIHVEDGIGMSNVMFSGYQAWVGGVGGFRMNDTRVAPSILSRNIVFQNVRGEQCQDANGYWFSLAATAPILSLSFENVLGASTAQGILVNGVLQLLLDGVTMATAAGKDSLKVIGATGGSVIQIRGCYWQPSSVFTLTGYTATLTDGFNSTLTVGPSNATYVNVLTGTQLNVAKINATGTAGTVVAALGSGTGDVLQVLSNAAGSGATLRSTNNAQNDFDPLGVTFSTLDLNYRTGVATTASMASVDTNGVLSLLKRVFVGTPAGAKQTASALSAGTGAPSNSDGVNGDIYFNGAGGSLTTIYQKRAGAWVGIV